jgi:surface antigen
MRQIKERLRVPLALCGALAGLALVGGAVPSTATSASAATIGASIVYVAQPLAPKGFGEVVAEVPQGTACRLTLALGSRVELRSAWGTSSTGEIDYTWTVPARVSSGARGATISCRDGSSAGVRISVIDGVRRRGNPLAKKINVTPIRATEPPTIAGKGGGGYPPFGSVILSGSSWFGGNGVNVYSDGSSGGGGYYQCVELANRFMTSEHFGPVIWGNANQLYADAQPAYYVQHPNGSGYVPVPGDLVVFGGGLYGHVAVVDSVMSTSVNLVEENASPTGRTTISLSGSTLGGIYDLYVIGVLHAKANPSSNPTSTPIATPPHTIAPPSGATTEVAGGPTHTMSDYTSAGGVFGPTIGSGQSVTVACRVTGFIVPDGNDWWYLVESSPWSGNYYASADAFYNNGQTSGSLLGTPFVDQNVPLCSSGGGTSPTTPETTGGHANAWSNPANAGGTEGPSIAANTTVQIACRLTGFQVADGNTWWYRIASAPWNGSFYVSADAFYNNGQTVGSLLGTPFVDPNVPLCDTPSPTPVPTPPTTFAETTGGVTHTWTNYANAGGSEGPSIPSNATVQVTCRLTGFAVADGNTWWYEIASSPWNNAYYASADAFYNNGETIGSLLGTPFVDTSVPVCV